MLNTGRTSTSGVVSWRYNRLDPKTNEGCAELFNLPGHPEDWRCFVGGKVRFCSQCLEFHFRHQLHSNYQKILKSSFPLSYPHNYTMKCSKIAHYLILCLLTVALFTSAGLTYLVFTKHDLPPFYHLMSVWPTVFLAFFLVIQYCDDIKTTGQ
jgi:hypothetical protein